ncbi:5-hydroxytryptamine receptor 3A-like [Littorina saxatilis]|uniref:5-hydroxytryptamine receptor 3A-like n=1 Tax=Littorina saxatilis TaxID=31220 RepID=UPI0038B4F15D
MQFWWIDPVLATTDDLDELFSDGNVSLLPESVTIPSDLLWLPPLVVVESISVSAILREVNEVEVKKNGQIFIELPYVVTFSCPFDMSGYPFDEHDCSVTLVDTSETVNVRPSGTPWDITLSQTFGVEGEWDLVDVVENVLVFENTGHIYAQCVLRLRRKATFYVVLMIVPMVMTSYLNVLVFLLPPDLGDKASYLVTDLISTSFFASFFNLEASTTSQESFGFLFSCWRKVFLLFSPASSC